MNTHNSVAPDLAEIVEDLKSVKIVPQWVTVKNGICEVAIILDKADSAAKIELLYERIQSVLDGTIVTKKETVGSGGNVEVRVKVRLDT